MTPDMVRRFWSLVGQFNGTELLAQRDDDLIRALLSASQQQHRLDHGQAKALNHYISTRLPLIREIALG